MEWSGIVLKSSRRLLKTDTFENFTRNGVNKVGYKRKKKTKKTQQVQYDDDDNHPVHSNEIGYSRIRKSAHGGSVLILQSQQ